MASRSRRRYRLCVLVIVVLLASPAVAEGLEAVGEEDVGDARRGGTNATGNVTFVSLQGGFGPATDGRVEAIDTDTGETLWTFARGGPDDDVVYYDVDPLSPEELLVVEHVTGENASVLRVNWRTDEVLTLFAVPPDTHDVDHLGNDRYVVADKFHHRAYVYDRSDDSIVWEYAFSEHFPEYPAAGEAPSTRPSGTGGYTHLNDVDAVDGGSAFLLSPRNFDRVVLVDRATKRTAFVLGAEDDASVLHEQHNPTLLTMDPPTVLVADSENDRVVEYRRRDDGSWALDWEYRGDLHWPRDADRLPNGNTLVVDTYGQRVIEVTPEKEIVWEHSIQLMPYDVERLQYGDEPRGSPVRAASTGSTPAGQTTSPAREVYVHALWVLPGWLGFHEFYALLGAVSVVCLWLVAELLAYLGSTPGRA